MFLTTTGFQKFQDDFYRNFIKSDRYKYLLDGLGVTLKVTIFALIVGLVIGIFIAIIRSSYDKTHTTKYSSPLHAFLQILLSIANFLCNIYLTVIRGTPSTVQLMIIYFVIFGSVNIDKVIVAICAFGINSGAYVAEIIRSGIMSVDNGQFEAGRSLGFGYVQTMWYIIMPQAFKNVLPALGNEVIVLLKETSISGYIALEDLTMGANIIRGQTYSAFLPLFAAAFIYLVIVMLLSAGVKKLEQNARANER